MKQSFKQIAVLLAVLFAVSCSKKDAELFSIDIDEFKKYADACGMSVDCKAIPASKLKVEHENSGMSAAEVAENLSDLDRLPSIMLYILSETTKITTTDGGVANAKGFTYLKDEEARGWGGRTYSEVPGVSLIKDGACNVVLGTLPTGSSSLLMHELSHCVDKVMKLSDKSTKLNSLFSLYKKNPVKQDPNYDYAMSDPEEFFAEQVTLAYHSESSLEKRDEWYPESKELFEAELIGEMLKALGGQSVMIAFK